MLCLIPLPLLHYIRAAVAADAAAGAADDADAAALLLAQNYSKGSS